jgi:hypothetical protein
MVWVMCCRIVVHRPARSNGKGTARQLIASGGGRRGLQVVAAVGDDKDVELGDVGVDGFFEVWHLFQIGNLHPPGFLGWTGRCVAAVGVMQVGRVDR